MELPQLKRKPSTKQGRCIALFGVPFTGKTTILQSIMESSSRVVAVVSTGDISRSLLTDEDRSAMANGCLFPREKELREEVLKKVNLFRSRGAEVIFLD